MPILNRFIEDVNRFIQNTFAKKNLIPCIHLGQRWLGGATGNRTQAWSVFDNLGKSNYFGYTCNCNITILTLAASWLHRQPNENHKKCLLN